MAFLIINANPS